MDSIVSVRNIEFAYPSGRRKVLDGCSLSLQEGDLVSILGPNGAGKSTLLNCACGLLSPQSGEIFLNGKNIKGMDPKQVAQVIGYVQQNQKSVFGYTVFSYVLMGRASSVGLFQRPNKEDEEMVHEVLGSMGVGHLADVPITEISGGERQQAAIARAIVQKPQAVFFDEPTAHLDYGNQVNTLKLIASLRDKGFAVIMTTHNPDHCMMLGGNVAILDRQGFLETGSVDEILTEERLKRVYNTELRLSYVDAVHRVACIPYGLHQSHS